MPRKLTFSLIISLGVLFTSYIVGNMRYPLGGEQKVLNSVDIVRSLLGFSHDSVPDEVLLVNVAFDKQLVPYEEEGMPVGNYVITDRRKLLAFLRAAKQADNYRYIMLDVVFEKGIHSDVDNELFGLIATMPRIVIPRHDDVELEDARLYSKAANSDYSITSEESGFTRFQFLHDSVPSMPLKMYNELTGHTITRHGLFFTSGGHLCKNALTLKLPIRMSSQYINKQAHLERSYINLGTDIIDIDSIIPVSEQTQGKVIVIGDFSNDIHSTYVGLLPGSAICLNAYYALLRGDHLINWWITLIILLVYVISIYIILSDTTAKKILKKYKLLRIAVSFVGMAVVLYLLALALYLCFHYVYNIVLPGYILAIIITIKQIYKAIKDEEPKPQTTVISPPAPGVNPSVCNPVAAAESRQIQDPLHELPAPHHRRKRGQGGHHVHRSGRDSLGQTAAGNKGNQPQDQAAEYAGGPRPKRKRTKRYRHSH